MEQYKVYTVKPENIVEKLEGIGHCKCGMKLDKSYRFCPKCGINLDWTNYKKK